MSRRSLSLALLLAIVVSGLAGCAQAGPTVPQAQSTPPLARDQTSQPAISPADREVPAPPPGSYRFDPPFPVLIQTLIDGAKADLATRLQLRTDQVEAIQVDGVVWPNRSLGCPDPGREYQAEGVDGTLIVLRAAGQIYVYHSAESQPAFLCEPRGS